MGCQLFYLFDLWKSLMRPRFFFSQQFLKEILNELCVYNKRGTHQGTYELKPEYKKSSEDVDQE